jgi:hypothetical protein
MAAQGTPGRRLGAACHRVCFVGNQLCRGPMLGVMRANQHGGLRVNSPGYRSGVARSPKLRSSANDPPAPGHGVWFGSDAAARPHADPVIGRAPTGRGVGRRCDVRSHSVHMELATIAAVVKIPQFPDWQRPGLWEIIHISRLLRREDFYNQCDSGILSAGRHLS